MEGASDHIAWSSTNDQRSVPATRPTFLEEVIHCAPWANGGPQLHLHPAKEGRAVVRRATPAGQRGKMSRDRAAATGSCTFAFELPGRVGERSSGPRKMDLFFPRPLAQNGPPLVAGGRW